MPTPPTLISITDQTGCHREAAAELRRALEAQGISVYDTNHPSAIELCFGQDGLRLQGGKGTTESTIIDFGNDSFIYRMMKGGGRKQPLGRAVGLKPGYSPLILDATAGLGRDGFLLASLGCRVILCERSAIIHALLRDGLARAATDPRLHAISSRITLYLGDSLQLMPVLAQEYRPEVIYLDPMFPHRNKSALVKKEMRMVRTVVGDDQDTCALLQAAMAHAGKRVVCKRPIQATPLVGAVLNGAPDQGGRNNAEGRRPDFAITTPKHRFDIYLTTPRADMRDSESENTY